MNQEASKPRRRKDTSIRVSRKLHAKLDKMRLLLEKEKRYETFEEMLWRLLKDLERLKAQVEALKSLDKLAEPQATAGSLGAVVVDKNGRTVGLLTASTAAGIDRSKKSREAEKR